MFESCFAALREKAPIIHCINNYVTANDTANILLACGARPVMADDPEEAAEITSACAGLDINMGTPSRRRIESMFLAGARANELGHAVVLDPVGVGASRLRIETAARLTERIRFDVIRGNVSEIRALALGCGGEKGVDASAADIVTEGNLPRAAASAKAFSKRMRAVVVLTGAIDLVADGSVCYAVRNGRPEMGKVTGTGCQLSALVTAFAAANPERKLEAAAAAVCAMGLAGEIGAANLRPGEGNATLRNRIIDAVSTMDGKILAAGAKYEIL